MNEIEKDRFPVLTSEMLEQMLPTKMTAAVRITPEVATAILTRNVQNRRIRTSTVTKYAKNMADGLWIFNGDTISFSSDGNLFDGQHRLLACVRSKKTIETIVVFGVDQSANPTKDTGLRRTGQDTLTWLTVPNASAIKPIVRWVTLINQGRVTTRASFDNIEIASHYKALNSFLLQEAVKVHRQALKVEMKGFPVGPFGALYYKFSEIDPVFSEAFFRSWVSEYDSESAFVSLRKARDAINRIRVESHGRMHEVFWLFCIVTAWNLACAGKTGSSKSFEWDRKSFIEIERPR
jgi:hypothetical protein